MQERQHDFIREIRHEQVVQQQKYFYVKYVEQSKKLNFKEIELQEKEEAIPFMDLPGGLKVLKDQ